MTGACDPVSAATTAFCVIDVTFDVAWLWMALGGGDRPPRARAPSRSASRSSRTPSTPIRRCTARSRHVSRQHARQVVRHRRRRSASRSRDRRPPRCPAAPRRRRSPPSSASEISAPVGIARRVDDDAARARRDRVEDRLGADREAVLRVASATSTGVASASLICSVSVGQYGAWVMTSSPGPNSASAVLYSACLPPALTDDLGLRVLDAVVDPVALADRALQLGDAGDRRVSGEVRVDAPRAPAPLIASGVRSPARRRRSR